MRTLFIFFTLSFLYFPLCAEDLGGGYTDIYKLEKDASTHLQKYILNYGDAHEARLIALVDYLSMKLDNNVPLTDEDREFGQSIRSLMTGAHMHHFWIQQNILNEPGSDPVNRKKIYPPDYLRAIGDHMPDERTEIFLLHIKNQ